MKKMLVALGIAALIAVPSAAAIAAGSDGPTPYSVTVEGIQLPAGETFKDGGHVNVKSNQGDRGIHFESLNNQPSGQWIGKSFLPWSALGYDTEGLCVGWVQLSQYNEHFGEGGQQPVGKGCTPWPTVSPTPSPTPTVTPSPSPTPTVTPTPTSTPTPSTTPSPTSTPSTTPSPVVTPTTTPTATSYPVPTPDSTHPSSSARLAATGATPEDVGIKGMIVGGALLALIGLVLMVNVYKR